MADALWLSEAVVQFIKGPLFINPLTSFIDERCIIFTPEEENKLEYTACHNDFKELVGNLLMDFIGDLGVTQDEFDEPVVATQETNQLAAFVDAVDDFLMFKSMMVRRNIDLATQIIPAPGMMSRDNVGQTSASRRQQGDPPLDPWHKFIYSPNSTTAYTPEQDTLALFLEKLCLATPGINTSNGGYGTTTSGQEPSSIYLCPITQDVMTDPVIATDGFTYERSAITEWLKMKTVSPMTNEPMPGGAGLIPNRALRASILEWKRN